MRPKYLTHSKEFYEAIGYGMTEIPSDVPGLLREIHFVSVNDNHRDWISCDKDILHYKIPAEFSKKNKLVLRDVIRKLGKDYKYVLEVGIARSQESSSTYEILTTKPEDTAYVGIDLNPACIEFVKEWNIPNTYPFLLNSGHFEDIVFSLHSLKFPHLDLLLIDGNHCANQVYLDFELASLVRVGGYVVLHDTNYHPGPSLLLECIDPTVFEIEKHCEGERDWGITTLKRIAP
jgi:hypothetical protein